MLGAGSQRGMEMTSSALNTVGVGARKGSNPFYLGNQEAPQRKRHSHCVLKEEQMFERRKGGARAFQVKEPAKGVAWRRQELVLKNGTQAAGDGGAQDVGGEGPSPKASGARVGATDAHERTHRHNTHRHTHSTYNTVPTERWQGCLL